MSYSWIERGFGHTSLYDELRALKDLYLEMDEACLQAAPQSGIVCPEGCGKCCVNFEPDILPREADFIAAYIIALRPEYFGVLSMPRSARQCPFFIAHAARHCGLYEARPSVCRLFGFAANMDKYGNPDYRSCRYMKTTPVRGPLPLMSRFGVRNTAAAGHGERRLMPLSPAVTDSLNKIRYLLSLHETSSRRTTDQRDKNPGDDRPTPSAA